MEKNKQLNTVIATSVLVVVIFVLGVVVGKSNSTAASLAPSNITNSQSEEVAVDFSRFWEAWQTLSAKYPFEEPSSDDKIYGAIQGLANSFGDPYTVYLPPAESESFNEDISGEFSGVGMEVGMRNGVITVVAPLKGTPAEKAGLQPGDIIYEIDSENTANMSIDSAVQNIRGERGSTVTLTILREGEFEPLEVSIVRDLIEVPTLASRLTDDGIFVIELYNFIGNIDAQFANAMREFKASDSDKLILDLRNNPGGFLQSSINLASWFLPTGDIIVREDFGDRLEGENLYRSLGTGDDFGRDYEMVVLINQGSASASEIVAGALAPLEHVTTVGETTFGKGSVQELVPMSNGTSLKVTVAKWYTPDGTSISENGLTPEIEVEFTREHFESETDPQFERAVSILLED